MVEKCVESSFFPTEALVELNNKIQQMQSSSTQGLFQLPLGTLSQEVEAPPSDVDKMKDTNSQVPL